MDWSKAKTIFIATFLCLNVFLGYQLYEKQRQSDYNVITQASLEQRLNTQQIEVEIDDPNQAPEGAPPIQGSYRIFDEAQLEEDLERQSPSLLNSITVFSELENPYNLSGANLNVSIEIFLMDYVYNGDEYEMASYSEEDGEIRLYQTYNDRKIDDYEGENHHLILHMSEELQVESYTQRYLDIHDQEEEDREQELLSPYNAIEQLLDSQLLPFNTTVENAELGYYSFVQHDELTQRFVPVWRIQTDDEVYYVNALNGEVQPSS